MLEREVAKRIFAQEYNESNLTFKESDDQYAPLYLLTPTGARCNRVFIAGTLTEKEDIGESAEHWRARVADPTGVFTIYAGQYQPEAAQMLSLIEPPQFIAVVGKTNTYDTGESIITSIRPESIQVIDAETRDRWIIETAKHTLERIAALGNDDPDAIKAKEHYSPDLEQYKQMVLQALKSIGTRQTVEEKPEKDDAEKVGFEVMDLSKT